MGIINKYINRSIEETIIKSFKNNKIVSILGARQIGKSTFVEHAFPKINIVTLKNDFMIMSVKNNPESFLRNNDVPLFIDEIQNVPELFGYIQEIVDKNNFYGQYILSGSNTLKLSDKIKQSLAGRTSLYELNGLSLREIYNINFNEHFVPTETYLNKRKNKLKEYKNVWNYIHRGSYPELYDNPKKDWEEFYSSYIQTFIEKDVINEIKIKDKVAFMKFLVSVASRTGEVLSYINIARDVEVDINTIKSWLSILIRNNIVFLLEPYYNSHLNRAIKSPKVYFKDTGLAAYLTSWLTKDQLERGAKAGNFFETFVVNEIIKTYTNEGKDYSKRVYYYRGFDKPYLKKDERNNFSFETEIDLIIEENGVLYPIEIKKKDNPDIYDAKAFDVLKRDKKNIGVGVIISMNKNKIFLNNNVLLLPIEYI